MHVHSSHSKHPSEWFLQRLGAAESYTDPEVVYSKAKENNMSFVTLTDHNTIDGALELQKKYPSEIITGVEATAYFPEDGCKVHILVFDINKSQFQIINNIRENIYLLRDYIKKENLAYSVAHASYSIDGKLKTEHLEKLILLFDIFEAQNGSRNRRLNLDWTSLLSSLTPHDIDKLYQKHKIEPYSSNPWIKGFTGGSDDHAGIFIGKTYTCAETETKEGFLELLKSKKTLASGRHNHFHGLAFAIYKIAYEFSRTKSKVLSDHFFSRLTELIFNQKELNLKSKLVLKSLKVKKKSMKPYQMIADLIENLRNSNFSNIDDTLSAVYDKIAMISDYFIKHFIESIRKDLEKGNIISIFKDISISLPGIFLSLPFLTAFRHLFNNRYLVSELSAGLNMSSLHNPDKKILWFTDTLTDLNGVSVVLKKIAGQSSLNNKNLKILTSLNKNEIVEELPPNIMVFEPVYSFKIPYYENLSINIPSLLKVLKEIYQYDPDEIYISTPGIIGLIGLFVSRLMNIKAVSVYHTDFMLQAEKLAGNESITSMVENYIRWFYNFSDEIKIPTAGYMEILEKRGYLPEKMSLFRRGYDVETFKPRMKKSMYFKNRFDLKKGINLLYAGRISKDKNLDLLIEAFLKASREGNNINLILAGDGPYLTELKNKIKNEKRILLTGRLPHEEMPEIYSDADIFVFPSTTDTFGMAVLEAQACGVPAVVTDVGGPKEIIQDGITGLVAKSGDINDWVEKIEFLCRLIKYKPRRYGEMCLASWLRMMENYSWENLFNDIYEKKPDRKKLNIKYRPKKRNLTTELIASLE